MSIRDTVLAWHRERLAGGALARDTEAYNQVSEALQDLIARLDPPPAEVAADPAAADTASKAGKAKAADPAQ